MTILWREIWTCPKLWIVPHEEVTADIFDKIRSLHPANDAFFFFEFLYEANLYTWIYKHTGCKRMRTNLFFFFAHLIIISADRTNKDFKNSFSCSLS